MTAVYTGASTTTKTVKITPISMGLAAIFGQNDVVLPSVLTPLDTLDGVVGFFAMPQQH